MGRVKVDPLWFEILDGGGRECSCKLTVVLSEEVPVSAFALSRCFFFEWPEFLKGSHVTQVICSACVASVQVTLLPCLSTSDLTSSVLGQTFL